MGLESSILEEGEVRFTLDPTATAAFSAIAYHEQTPPLGHSPVDRMFCPSIKHVRPRDHAFYFLGNGQPLNDIK